MKSPASPEQSDKVEAYLAALPAATCNHLQKLREAIRAAAPGAVESFGYGMPAFRLDGENFIWYAAWKKHSSLYPLSRATAQALAAKIEGYVISGKGTIQFPLDQPPPTALVKLLVKARIAEMRKRESIFR
jgi:uncharacterized protein YdhG (YjbR/CyaY superfamily)